VKTRKGKRALLATKALSTGHEEDGPPGPVDRDKASTTYAGTGWSASMPRYYPTPEGHRLPVHVRFESWKGISIGAVHTYAILESRPNPVWNGYTWLVAGDDPEKPQDVRGHFVRRDRAERWALRMLERLFPETAFEHCWASDPETGDPLPKPTIPPDPIEDAAIEPCPTCSAPIGEHGNDTHAEREVTKFCEMMRRIRADDDILDDEADA
jgi:hypothetical protein